MILATLLLPLFSCAGDSSLVAVAPAEPVPVRWAGWITPWDLDRGLARITAAPGAMDDVFVFAGQLTEEGRPFLAPRDRDYGAVVSRLRNEGVRPWLTVVNDVASGDGTRVRLKDAEVVHAVLAPPQRRREHVEDLVRLSRQLEVAGLDIDYENLAPEDRSLFSAFIRDLADELQRSGIELSVTVQPKTDDRRSTGVGATDWNALCASADRVQVMLYNLHGSHSGPGPVATSSWIRAVMAFGHSQCTAGQLVPVLKTSGFAWSANGVESLHMGRATAAARAHGATIQRDPDGAAPFFTYRDAGGLHTVYYEDAESLMTKVQTIFDTGASNVVFWSLGREDSDLLPRLIPIEDVQP